MKFRSIILALIITRFAGFAYVGMADDIPTLPGKTFDSPGDPLSYVIDTDFYLALDHARAQKSAGFQKLGSLFATDMQSSVAVQLSSMGLPIPETVKKIWVIKRPHHDVPTTNPKDLPVYAILIGGLNDMAWLLDTFDEGSYELSLARIHPITKANYGEDIVWFNSLDPLVALRVYPDSFMVCNQSDARKIAMHTLATTSTVARNGGFQYVRQSSEKHTLCLAMAPPKDFIEFIDGLFKKFEPAETLMPALQKMQMVSGLADWEANLAIAMRLDFSDAQAAQQIYNKLERIISFLKGAASHRVLASARPVIEGMTFSVEDRALRIGVRIPNDTAMRYLNDFITYMQTRQGKLNPLFGATQHPSARIPARRTPTPSPTPIKPMR